MKQPNSGDFMTFTEMFVEWVGNSFVNTLLNDSEQMSLELVEASV